MKRIIRLAVLIVVALCIIGFAYLLGVRHLMKRVEVNPNVQLALDAGNELCRLLEENKLPGITLNELEGTIRTSEIGLNENSVSYPAERTIQLHKRDEPDTVYFYTLSTTNSQAQWALVRAWKERSGIKVILKEFGPPIKE